MQERRATVCSVEMPVHAFRVLAKGHRLGGREPHPVPFQVGFLFAVPPRPTVASCDREEKITPLDGGVTSPGPSLTPLPPIEQNSI
jgi:hypothetical protein